MEKKGRKKPFSRCLFSQKRKRKKNLTKSEKSFCLFENNLILLFSFSFFFLFWGWACWFLFSLFSLFSFLFSSSFLTLFQFSRSSNCPIQQSRKRDKEKLKTRILKNSGKRFEIKKKFSVERKTQKSIDLDSRLSQSTLGGLFGF